MSCTEWEREIASDLESPEVAGHLRVCPNCREFAREIEANRTALQELAVDSAALTAVRLGVLNRIEAGKRRGAWWTWSLAGAACAAVVLITAMLPGLRNTAPPRPVEFAKNPPKIEWTVQPTPRPRARPDFGPVVAKAAPAQNTESMTVKMLTNDPNVIIIWLVDKKGDSL